MDGNGSNGRNVPLVAVLGSWRQPVKRLEGFEPHHFIPPRADDYHNAWIGKIAQPELTAEIESLRAKSRETRGWKRAQLPATVDAGFATLESPEWRFRISVRLDPDKKGVAVFGRRLETCDAAPISPEQLDALFDPVFNRVEIVPTASADIPALIDRFEARGWPVEYPLDDAYAEFTIPHGVVHIESQRIQIDFDADELPGQLLRNASHLLTPPDTTDSETPLLHFA